MKHSCYYFLVLCLAVFLPTLLLAQVPNAGFENWASGDPVDWWTNNAPPLLIPITQSSDAYNGSSSARMEVVDGGGFPYGAALYSGTNGTGFPCNQRFANVTGHYKFSPQNPTSFTISVTMIKNGAPIGSGGQVITAAASSWTQFMAPITYFAPGNPDTCNVYFLLTSELAIGGYVLIDDLAFSGISDIKPVDRSQIPNQFLLKQNYPNPFNPTTNIEFNIPKAANVKLVIYNQLGEIVASLVNERLSAGSYSVDWNAEGLPSGIYYYRIGAGDFKETRKLILMR